MTILVDKTGKIYFGIDGQDKRQQLIEKMATAYSITLTPDEIKRYSVLDVVGNPMQAMKTYLNLKPEVRDLPNNNL